MKNSMHKLYTVVSMYVMFYVGQAHAVDIKVPDFVPKVTTDSINKAGGSIWPWILAGFVTLIGLMAIAPAVLAIRGEREKAKELAINILYGAMIFVALPVIAIGVIKIM